MATRIAVEGFDGNLAEEFVALIDANDDPHARKKIRTWKHKKGLLWHAPGGGQTYLGLLLPDDDGTTFEVRRARGGQPLKNSDRGALVGRFIEMVISHFAGRYDSISVTH